MSKSKAKKKAELHVPRDILSRVRIGQAFAEYDRILLKPGILVKTPALIAAEDEDRGKCFFVGRRGTGKTAIASHLNQKHRSVMEIHPEIFATVGDLLNPADLQDTRQPPVRALVACLRRAIVDEVLRHHIDSNEIYFDQLPKDLKSERGYIQDFDFDTRAYNFIFDAFQSLDQKNQRAYLKQIKKSKDVLQSAEKNIAPIVPQIHVLIDRIDDSWDGSDTAVVLLMALMHACLDLATKGDLCRPFLFVRENVFDRVREVDTEFTRLRSCVESLDWTEEQLVEMIERRLQQAFNPKPAIGEAWDHLFENIHGVSSRTTVFAYCQKRPRDVIRFCSTAIDGAVSRKHERVTAEDLIDAQRQFSVLSLKDLADEYCENYSQVQLVLSRFHGLAPEFTITAIGMFLQKLLVDEQVKKYCAEWIYNYTTPSLFVELLWSIGFFGIKSNSMGVQYRGFGVLESAPPAISESSHAVIHPSYHDALDLQAGKVIGELSDETGLQTTGFLIDLPEALNLDQYHQQIDETKEALETLPTGRDHAKQYEEIVGAVIKLCFFRWLVNIQERESDYENRVIRDWIASNRAEGGFWEMIRTQYGAVQTLWECKNYPKLKADDFHQCSYYMNETIGRFIIVCFRGDREDLDSYAPHLRRIATDKRGCVLLLTDQDLHVFLRQAKRGKVKEDHIRERFDATVRLVS